MRQPQYYEKHKQLKHITGAGRAHGGHSASLNTMKNTILFDSFSDL